MTDGYNDIQKTGISSEDFTIPAIDAPRYYQTLSLSPLSRQK